MQATDLHTQEAVLLLHPRSGGCHDTKREKRPFKHRLTHRFHQADARKELYTLWNMIATTT